MNGNPAKIKIYPFLFLAFLILPSLAWIARDHYSFRYFDDSQYAIKTVTLYMTLIDSPLSWPRAFFSIMRTKLPMMIWLYQFFVPLGYLAGSVGRALLVGIAATQLASLSLLFIILKRVFRHSILAAAGCLAAASAPIFVYMSTSYIAEPLQLFVVIWFVYCAVTASERDSITNLLYLTIAGTCAMLVKVTSAVYCLGPACILLWHIARAKPSVRRWNPRTHLPLLLTALSLLFMAGLWYAMNMVPMMQERSYALFGALWGSNASFSSKFVYWSGALVKNYFVRLVIPCVVFLFAAGVYFFLKKRKGRVMADLVSFIGLAQILLFLSAASCVQNELTRFLLPLLPYVILLVCWSLSQINSRLMYAAACLVFASQFVMVHAYALGVTKYEAFARSFYHGENTLRPMETYNPTRALLDEIIDATRTVAAPRHARILGFAAYYRFRRGLNFYELITFNPSQLQRFHTYRWTRFPFGMCMRQGYSKEKAWEFFLSQEPLYYLDIDPAHGQKGRRFYRHILKKRQKQYEYALYIREMIETSGLFTAIPLPGHPEILLYKYGDDRTGDRA